MAGCCKLGYTPGVIHVSCSTVSPNISRELAEERRPLIYQALLRCGRCHVLYMKNHEDMIGRANNIYTTFDPIHTVSLGTGPKFKIRASSGYMEAKAKKSAFAQMMMHLDPVYYSNYHSFENLFWAKHFRSQRYF